MSKHPLNLAVRFALEVGAILTFGIWGFSLSELWTRYLLVILLPLGFALLWGIFAVPNDQYFQKFTTTVNGQTGGAPGDLLILRIAYSGSYRGAIIFGSTEGTNSHITVPGDIPVSQASSGRIMAVKPHDDTKIYNNVTDKTEYR